MGVWEDIKESFREVVGDITTVSKDPIGAVKSKAGQVKEQAKTIISRGGGGGSVSPSSGGGGGYYSRGGGGSGSPSSGGGVSASQLAEQQRQAKIKAIAEKLAAEKRKGQE